MTVTTKAKELKSIMTPLESDLVASSFEIEICKNYKFRLYPNKTQTERLEQVLGICQRLYNAALQQWSDTYRLWKQSNMGTLCTLLESGVALIQTDCLNPKAEGVDVRPPKVNYFTQSAELTQLKDDFSELKQVYDKILRDVLRRVDKTCQAFYRRAKKGENPGYPRYKSWSRYHSFTYPEAASEEADGIDKAPGWILSNNKLTLRMGKGTEPIGPIKIKLHRPAYGKVRTLTIVRKGDEWYACFTVIQKKTLEKQINEPSQATSPVGVSLGLETYATLSNGESFGNPRFNQRNHKQLVKAQQTLSRKTEQKKKLRIKETKDNCQNLKKARLNLSRIHRHIANQRHNFLHNLSKQLVTRFDGIVFGDLDIKAMVKRPEVQVDAEKSKAQGQTVYAPNGQTIEANYNRAILDAAWGTLISFTTYKAAEAGKLCLRLDLKGSSQTCCNCGWKSEEPLELEEQEFSCGGCGLKILRHHNTAINLLEKQFGANCVDKVYLQKIGSSVTFNATD